MGLTAALAALAVSVIPASVAEAAPDETDFWDSVDVSGLEALQAYSGGGKVPGGPDGSWYSYPEGMDAAVPYTDLPEQYASLFTEIKHRDKSGAAAGILLYCA